MNLSEAKKLPWGTYGPPPNGNINKVGPGPLRWTTLGACVTSYLQAILKTQHHITAQYREAIAEILKARGIA